MKKEEIIESLEKWFNSHPKKEDKLYFMDGTDISPKDIIEAVKNGTEFGKSIIKSVIDLEAKGIDISNLCQK